MNNRLDISEIFLKGPLNPNPKKKKKKKRTIHIQYFDLSYTTCIYDVQHNYRTVYLGFLKLLEKFAVKYLRNKGTL